MPRGDRTGPLGMGPLTGRGAGFCAGFNIPGYLNTRFGRGLWLGRGRGDRCALWLVGVIPGCIYIAYFLFNRSKIQKRDYEERW